MQRKRRMSTNRDDAQVKCSETFQFENEKSFDIDQIVSVRMLGILLLIAR